VIAPAPDRSVLGILVDTAKSVPHHLEAESWDDTTLPFVELPLAETPWHAGKRIADIEFPSKIAPRLPADRREAR
jgi:hypothetical protein